MAVGMGHSRYQGLFRDAGAQGDLPPGLGPSGLRIFGCERPVSGEYPICNNLSIVLLPFAVIELQST